MITALLAPSGWMERRGTAVDSAAADLRRIERDLHDGAQARLVALAMDLGMARERARAIEESPAAVVSVGFRGCFRVILW